MLLNTKCAVLTEFVQLLKHVCAVTNWGFIKVGKGGEGRENGEEGRGEM